MSDTGIEPAYDDDEDEPPLCAELRLVFVAPSSIVTIPAFQMAHKKLMTIGRRTSCDIHIDSSGVSEDHATVYALEKEDSWEVVLTDCGSTNGTTVNGRRIKSQQLNDGDIVGIGSSFLVFREHQTSIADCKIPGIVGCSPEIREVRGQVAVYAREDSTVLLQGESGVGKEVVAVALHSMSGRSGPFVPYNCASLGSSLAHSILFGHKKGSFTGALTDHDGLFAQASVGQEGGTLFLDEVADLTMDAQSLLLRVLDNPTYRPYGASVDQKSKARVVTGTKTVVRSATEQGLFRDDLFQRIKTMTIMIPPLRERREDILLLAKHFLENSKRTVSSSLAYALLLHPWPGNVRELRGILARANAIAKQSGKSELRASHCRKEMEESAQAWFKQHPAEDALSLSDSTEEPDKPIGRPTKAELERVFGECNGRVLRIAKYFKVDRKTIRRWLVQYGLRDDLKKTQA